MSDPTIKVVIPFRDRGIDLRRGANLEVVQAWWWAHGFNPALVDDGLEGDAQFNRHRAYNRAVAMFPEVDVFVFTEADMLIHPVQIRFATRFAYDQPGLVVPFTQYRYLSDSTTEIVRDAYFRLGAKDIAEWWSKSPQDVFSIFGLDPESIRDDQRSIGAVNVVSAETLRMTGGFTEFTRGNWYDDRIIEEGFAFLTGRRTRFVSGPAVHLYHLPGWQGDHLTDEDRAATEHNRQALIAMRGYIKHRDWIAAKSMMEVRA
jgi:hypothetical protein